MKNLKRHHDEGTPNENEFKASKATVLEAAKRRWLSPVEPQPAPAHQHAAIAPGATIVAATESTEPPSTTAQVRGGAVAAGRQPTESTEPTGALRFRVQVRWDAGGIFTARRKFMSGASLSSAEINDLCVKELQQPRRQKGLGSLAPLGSDVLAPGNCVLESRKARQWACSAMGRPSG